MAEEIAYRVSVDAGEGGKSLKQLKTDFKEAQNELNGLTTGTKEYVAQLAKLGKIRDDIGDLNAEINAFNPEGKVKAFSTVIGGVASGFQAATGAAALFGGENKDLEKTLVKVQAAMAFTEGLKGLASLGDGFKVLGNIIKANPIFLLVGAIVAIGVALFELKDKIPFVGKAFEVIGEVIDAVKETLFKFTDALGITHHEMDRLADSIIASAEKIKKATGDRYDSEIAAAKRAGVETEAIEIQKLNAITKTNDAAIAQLRLRQQEQGKLNDEDKKKLDELVLENRNAYKQILDLSDAYKDRDAENKAKQTDNWNKEAERQKEIERKKYDEMHAYAVQAAINLELFTQEQKAKEKALADQEQAEKFAAMDAETDKFFEEADTRKQRIEVDAASEQQLRQTQFTLAQTSTQGLMSLNELYFTVKRKNLQKGSKEELAAAKKQFEINKALSIVSATISGIQGVVNALSAQSTIPEPYGTILKVATAAGIGVAAAANIAKISSTSFDGGGASAGSLASPSGGGTTPTIPNTTAPAISAPASGITQLDSNGNVISNNRRQPEIRATVVETDMTNSQRRVSSLETNAKI